MAKREWRKPESYDAEKHTRSLVRPFLERRGYTAVEDTRYKVGSGESQLVDAVGPDGQAVRCRVKLCWRWGTQSQRGQYSAAQLTAKYRGSFDATIDSLILRNQKDGITHLLLFQSDGMELVLAAMVPIADVGGIWAQQREVSNRMIADGMMGKVRKNHAENGDSPTLWLADNRAPGGQFVAKVLWEWPGVINLTTLPIATNRPLDDTYDDLAYAEDIHGSEDAPRHITTRSQVKRDPSVRRQVVRRAKQGCERPGCPDERIFPGFLDVHHVLGVEKSDRAWTCVALCPNCHREAHFGSSTNELNAELLRFATQFMPRTTDSSARGKTLS